jgi:hypothetical protein
MYVVSSNLVFSFGAVSNRSYAVEWTAGLSPANWQAWTNLTGNGAQMSVSAPIGTASRRFFRVRQP